MNSSDEKLLSPRDVLEAMLNALLSEQSKPDADIIAISREIREVADAIQSADGISKLRSEMADQEQKLLLKEHKLSCKALDLDYKENELERREIDLGLYRSNLREVNETSKKSFIQRFLQYLRCE